MSTPATSSSAAPSAPRAQRGRHSPLTRAVVLIATLLGMSLTAALGRWQLGRAEQKIALTQARAQQAAQPELDTAALLAALSGPVAAAHADSPSAVHSSAAHPSANKPSSNTPPQPTLLHRRLHLQGQWLAEHTVYLDNRQMHGRPGFYVYTPLRLQGSEAVVLVQRGWIARHFQDRTALAPISTPPGPVTLRGQLLPWPAKVYDFATPETGAIRQNLAFDAFRHQTGLPLPALSLQQTDPDSEGLQRAWPEIATGVEKHYGYAFQWFGLCGLIALLYVWFQIVQPRRKQRPA